MNHYSTSKRPSGLGVFLVLMLVITFLGTGILFVIQSHPNDVPASQPTANGSSHFTTSGGPATSASPVKVEEISYDPSTISCTAPVSFNETIYLPNSVQAGEKVTVKLNGNILTILAVSSQFGFVALTNGRWQLNKSIMPNLILQACQSSSSSSSNSNHSFGEISLAIGQHTTQIYSAAGVLVAQGSYTVTP